MPIIKDKRVIEGKKNRDNEIRKYFNKRWSEGFRYDVIETEVIAKWGVSSSAITKIMKHPDN
ncbi:MAG: hypothetical protein PHH37_08440 [Paludibacter sp.]|nr:hypothetical protein [Paludibacter sp.]